MSKLSVGTIVMLRCPLPLTLEEHLIVNGAVGEITSLVSNLPGDVRVLFPSYPSEHSSKQWNCKKEWLIPLSDPDADVSVWDNVPLQQRYEKID